MFITDAQIHLWGPDTPERPWSAEYAGRTVMHEASAAISEMDAAGVDRAVIIPPSWEGLHNDVVLAAAHDYPERFGVMGSLSFLDQDTFDASTWRDKPDMLGARAIFVHPGNEVIGAKAFLADGTADWFFAAAEEHNIPFMTFAPGLNQEVGEVARRHPGLRLIVDHINLDRHIHGDGIGPSIDEVIPLAACPNIAVKVSGLPHLISDASELPSLQPHIRRVIDAFGPDRCMWGSDASGLHCSYVEWVDASLEAISYLSASDQQAVMNDTLEQLLRWPAPASRGD